MRRGSFDRDRVRHALGALAAAAVLAIVIAAVLGAARTASGRFAGATSNENSLLTAAALDLTVAAGDADPANPIGAASVQSVEDTAAISSSLTGWTHVELRTDELGSSTVLLDRTVVAGPTVHSGGPGRGSGGLRVAQLTTGNAYVDDVRIRRYVSDEPTATLGPLVRL